MEKASPSMTGAEHSNGLPDTTGTGYLIAVTDDSGFYMPNIYHIQRDDSMEIYPDDNAAAVAAEKAGIKLIHGMPNVPDGIYIDTPENRGAIAAYFEQHRRTLPADIELVQALTDLLDENFDKYKSEILQLSKAEIFASAAEIADVFQCYEYFKNEHQFTTGQAEFLLHFQNPLDLISDRWLGSPTDNSYAVKLVFSDQERILQNSGYTLAGNDPASAPVRPEPPHKTVGDDGEKPSVLEQIREAAKTPKEPRGDKPSRDKSGPEL